MNIYLPIKQKLWRSADEIYQKLYRYRRRRHTMLSLISRTPFNPEELSKILHELVMQGKISYEGQYIVAHKSPIAVTKKGTMRKYRVSLPKNNLSNVLSRMMESKIITRIKNNPQEVFTIDSFQDILDNSYNEQMLSKSISRLTKKRMIILRDDGSYKMPTLQERYP